METGKGVFVVIEGVDGSGKATQFKRLTERLTQEGYDVTTFDFPQYEHPSSYFVKEYLNGKYGSADEVGPYTSSLFYALDRFEAAAKIRQALDEGKVVLSNRYVGSNMGHQGTKFRHAEERRGFFIWLDNLEFEMLRIPRPTLSLVLRVPAEVSQKLVERKQQTSLRHKDLKQDIHEDDSEHLRRAVEVYDDICHLFPKDFSRIDCTRDNELLDIDIIGDIIWQKVEPMLPAKSAAGRTKPARRNASPAAASRQDNLVESTVVDQKPDGKEQLSATGKHLLDELVSSTTGSIYTLTDKLTPRQAAGVLAQVSSQGSDIRELLKEFDMTDGASRPALDDQAKHLAHDTLVIGSASQLLISKMQHDPATMYIRQPLHAARHDQKKDGSYTYFTPEHLGPELTAQYRTHMDQLFDLYAEIVHGVTTHLHGISTTSKDEQDAAWRSALTRKAYSVAGAVLPVAASSAIAVHASIEGTEELVRHLLGDSLPEARKAVEALLGEIKKNDPDFLDRLNQAESGATITYQAAARQKTGKQARNLLLETHADPLTGARLTSAAPRNEFDIIPDMLYSHSNLSLTELRQASTNWPYEQKLQLFGVYLGERRSRRQRPGRALENIRYSWDVVSDFATFTDLQTHQQVSDLQRQTLTPRFGYDVPQIIEDAGLLDEFETAFEVSLKLHSLLQAAGYHLEAEYATLLGHNMRWKVAFNAREAFRIFESITAETRPATRALLEAMHERLAEVHPIIGEAIAFTQPKPTILTAKA